MASSLPLSDYSPFRKIVIDLKSLLCEIIWIVYGNMDGEIGGDQDLWVHTII